MNNYIENIVKEVSENYYNSAIRYYQTGLYLLHNNLEESWENHQPAIGNLSIALELLLKSLIAKESLTQIYKNLPPEARLYLSNPSLIKNIKSFRRYEIELKSSSYHTIEFKDCIGLIYLIKPELRSNYKSYFPQITEIRNKSVHSFLPNFEKYDLSRIGYFVLTIFKELLSPIKFRTINRQFAKQNKLFLNRYSEEKTLKVEKLIDEAKKKSKEINHTGIKLESNSWWEFITECPICKSDAILEGETDIEYIGDDQLLTFFADKLMCSECKLSLEVDEFKLAGIDQLYDRSEEIDEWNNEFPYEPDYE